MAESKSESKFAFYRKISLASVLSESHGDDYLQFDEVTFREIQELTEAQARADEALDEIKEKKLKDLTSEERKKKREASLKATNEMADLLGNKLISGEVYNDRTEKRVGVDPDDLRNLPFRALTYCVKELSGGVDENLDTQ